MNERARASLLGLVLFGCAAPAAFAADRPTVTIAMFEIEGDPRYEPPPTYAGIMQRRRGRPYDGAELALRESKIVGRALGMRFALERRKVADAGAMVAAVSEMREASGAAFFIVDADADTIANLARATVDAQITLFNVSSTDDRLRGEDCQPHLVHTLPSQRMLTDALAQFLVSKRWRNVLALVGSHPHDALLAQSFEHSARRFGAKIVERREFVLSNDPRERGKNNVALLTAGSDHDVVFLADTDGEFGRYVPYHTNRPRPVVGTEGLVADTWHWAWERHGAPQLNQRFERRADRKMQDADWAAWAAVRLIVESAVRTRSTDPEAMTAYMLGDSMTFDGYKGKALSFRPWDNQLRQAIFLRTHNAVIERAPLEGFLHQTENLDTLGADRAESACKR